MLVRARLSVKNLPGKRAAAPSRRAANGRPYTFNRQECDFLEERNPSKQLAAQRLAGAGERGWQAPDCQGYSAGPAHSYFSARPMLRIYLSGVCENSSHQLAPKTAPKRVWDGSAPCSTFLYTWDKIRFAPWYAIPPNSTKQHLNAQILDFS